MRFLNDAEQARRLPRHDPGLTEHEISVNDRPMGFLIEIEPAQLTAILKRSAEIVTSADVIREYESLYLVNRHTPASQSRNPLSVKKTIGPTLESLGCAKLKYRPIRDDEGRRSRAMTWRNPYARARATQHE